MGMRRDLTTSSTGHQDSRNAATQIRDSSWRLGGFPLLSAVRLLAAMALGALLIALAYQIPVTHTVDIGGYDSAYTQGFYDPERNTPSSLRPELAGSDGSARWTRATSDLLFPQAGLPAQVTLRLRGWRTIGPAPEVTLLLNGTQVLDRFRASAAWQDHTFQIDDGLLKPNDVVIEIRSETTQLDKDDPRAVGVLLDSVTYYAGPAPIIPYPPQLLYGALAAGLLYVLLVTHHETRRQRDQETGSSDHALLVSWSPGLLVWIGSVLILSLGFLALYRAQPPYPYPLSRLQPAIDGTLAALLAIRYGPPLARRIPIVLDGLAVGGIGVWAAAVLASAQQHVTLSVPSVESDFRVFALRSAQLVARFPAGTTNPDVDGVFRADGFYNLGYPLLLWLVRPFTDGNPFLAARLVAALSGALLLLAGWWLARQLLGRGAALLALLVLGFSPLVVEFSLYVGTDLPFAAVCVLALALLVRATKDQGLPLRVAKGPTTKEHGHERSFVVHHAWLVALAGLAAGLAFLIRHPGLLLLPFGWLVLVWVQVTRHRSQAAQELRQTGWSLRPLAIFTLAFCLAILPQLVVNVRDTGLPFFSQQAKNVWQGVFGDGDWGRWANTANEISIGQVIAQDPARFLANWWSNLRGYFGSGGEDTREFGQAIQLRLLGFPANWLAIGGLLGWLVLGLRQLRQVDRTVKEDSFRFSASLLLVVWIALYVLALSVGLPLQSRFFLPLAPIYAIAAAWTVAQLRTTPRTQPLSPNDVAASGTQYVIRGAQYKLAAGIALLVLLWGGFATGSAYVLRARPADEAALARAENRMEAPGQPDDEVHIIRLVLATLQPGERLVIRTNPRVPIGKYSAIAHLSVAAPASLDPAALRTAGAQYLIWDASLGPAPTIGTAVGDAGSYTLYRIIP
jgi:4-amino-4-deoxy-L-arabinose transferase-like glycosyltransferase